MHTESRTKIKLNSTHHGNQDNFEQCTKFKPISIPRYKNQLSFDPDAKSKPFSTPTRQRSQFRSLQLKSSQVRSPTLKSGQFRPNTKSSVILACTEIKLISTHHGNQEDFERYTKFRSILRPRQNNQVISTNSTKQSRARCSHYNQVISAAF